MAGLAGGDGLHAAPSRRRSAVAGRGRISHVTSSRRPGRVGSADPICGRGRGRVAPAQHTASRSCHRLTSSMAMLSTTIDHTPIAYSNTSRTTGDARLTMRNGTGRRSMSEPTIRAEPAHPNDWITGCSTAARRAPPRSRHLHWGEVDRQHPQRPKLRRNGSNQAAKDCRATCPTAGKRLTRCHRGRPGPKAVAGTRGSAWVCGGLVGVALIRRTTDILDCMYHARPRDLRAQETEVRPPMHGLRSGSAGCEKGGLSAAWAQVSDALPTENGVRRGEQRSDEFSPECHTRSSHTSADWRSSTGRGIATGNRRSA